MEKLILALKVYLQPSINTLSEQGVQLQHLYSLPWLVVIQETLAA